MLLQPFDGGGQQGDSHPPPQVLEDGLGIILVQVPGNRVKFPETGGGWFSG